MKYYYQLNHQGILILFHLIFFSARNPFEHNPPNPFQATKVQKPAMNQLLQQQSSKFVFS